MARLVIEIGKGKEAEAQLNAIKQAMAKVGGSATILNGDLKKLERQNQAVEQRFRTLAASLDPAIAKSNALARATKTLERALQTGVISQKEHDRLLQLATQRYGEAAGGATRLGGSIGQLASRYLGWASALALAGQALKTSIRAALEAEDAAKRLEVAVRLKGEAYGITAERLSALATELEQVTRFEDEAIQQAEAILLRFDSIDGSNIAEVTRLTLDFAEATGQTAPAAAAALGKALEAPGENLRALKDAGILLDDQQRQMIETLVDTGRAAEAQAALIGILQQKIGGLAQEMGTTSSGAFAQFTHAMGNLAEVLGAPVLEGMAAEARDLTEGIELLNGKLSEGGKASESYLGKLWALTGPLNLLIALHLKFKETFRDAVEVAETAEPEKAFIKATNHLPALRKLREELEKIQQQKADDGLDRASAAMFEAGAKAKKAADELQRLRDNLVAIGHMEPLEVKRPDYQPPTLTAAGAAVPEHLVEAYREYTTLLGQVETVETRLARLREAGVITQEELNAALAFQNEAIITAADSTDELAEQWEAFQKQVEENFIRGVQTALADFFVAVFEGGEDAMANFADALKQLLFKTLAEYLAQWIITQAKMLAASLARIAKEKTAQQAANSAGGGGGGAGGFGSLLGGGGGGAGGMSSGAWGAAIGIAVVAAFAAVAKYQKDKHEAQQYGTEVSSAQFNGQISTDWRGKLDQTGAAAAKAIADLMNGLQDATGAFVDGMAAISIRIRNDKKAFQVLVGGELVGYFTSMNEAVIAAVRESFLNSDLSKDLPKAIQEAIEGYKGADPEELLSNIRTIQAVLDEISGLSDVEIELQNLPQKADALSDSLRNMGVSMGEATRVSSEWRLMQMNSLRDQITGRQQTAAEERAAFEQKRALFNAELALWRVELQQKIAELEARTRVVEAGGRLGEFGIDLETERLNRLGGLLESQGELYDQELQLRANFLGASAGILETQGSLLAEQLAALKAVLAALPTEIGAHEFRPSGSGRGGGAGRVSSGPSRADREASVRDTLSSLAAELLPTMVAQSQALTARFAELREEMAALGMATAELDALEAAHRARLAEQAQGEVGQYLQTGPQAQLQEIYRWRDEMVATYTELGLDLQPVLDATAERLRALGQDVLGGLGLASLSTRQQFEDLGAALDFLRTNLDALGLSAEEFGEITAELGNQMFLSLADGLAQFVGTEEQKAALEQLRWEMELYNYQLQFEYLQSLGLLTAEQIAMVQALLDAAAGYDPTGGSGVFDPFGVAGGGDSSNAGGYWGSGGGADADSSMQDLIRALDRLREFQESMLLDESITPLSLSDQYSQASADYQQILAEIAAAQAAGDTALEAELIGQLPDIASTYLQLAAQMFGTSTNAYQAIFQAVYDQITALLGEYEEPATGWQQVHNDLGGVRGDLSIANDWASQAWYQRDDQNYILTQMLGVLEDTDPGVGGGGGGTSESLLYGMASRSASSATYYRGAASLPGNVLVYQSAGGGPQVEALRREVDRLGQRLERGLDRLAKAQVSAGELRARAAGGSR